jgi:hypothetical protein
VNKTPPSPLMEREPEGEVRKSVCFISNGENAQFSICLEFVCNLEFI